MKIFNSKLVQGLLLFLIWPIGIIIYWLKSTSKVYVKVIMSVASLAFSVIMIFLIYVVSIPEEQTLFSDAETCLEKNDTTGAYINYTKAIKVNPKYSLAYRRRGDLYQNQYKIDEALADFNLSLEFETDEILKAETYVNKAECLIAQYRYREAIEFLDLGVALNPEEIHYSVIKLGVLDKTGEYQRGIVTANQILESSPDNILTLFFRATFKYYLKQYSGALLDISRVLELNPREGEYYLIRGLIYDDIGEHEKGCLDFKTSSDLKFEKGIDKYQEHCI